MSKRSLGFLAVLLSILIVAVLFAGLDDLPRGVRDRIAAERRNYAAASGQLQSVRNEVLGEVRTDPALFRVSGRDTLWTARLQQADARLGQASANLGELAQMERANRRQDSEKSEKLLAREAALRTSALAEATAVRSEVKALLDRKQHLPQEAERMGRDYNAAHAADLGALTGTVQRAGSDWPEKKADLESRLAALRETQGLAERTWNSSADLRRKAAAGDTSIDYAALFTEADALHGAAASLPARTTELKAISDQLYYSWDKVLVDMEARGSGKAREYNQKIQTVRTHLVDVAAKKSETTTDEKWIQVSQSAFDAMDKNVGMAIEHKSAGKYDSEAERMVQPAGLAYVAPPSQKSNQYGYWENRGGQNLWVFYGQYALLRDLLWSRDYRPVSGGEYDQYSSARRGGTTYYGHSDAGGTPKYGTYGTARKPETTSYRGSQYATRSGGYRGSGYASPQSRRPDADYTPRAFGRSGSEASKGSTPYRGKDESGSWRGFYRERGGASSSGRSSPSFGGSSRRFGGGGGRSFGRGRR
jgi:hypothetical protein